MRSIRASLYRGGTSKGVFLHLCDLPPFGDELDQLLLSIMGSPDPMQIDGLGGTYTSTSKVIIVAPGQEPGIDVRYWFAQIGITEPIVEWSGNCGNLTTAVGAFAITEDLVKAVEPVTEIHMRNENTGVEVVSLIPVVGGSVVERGALFIAGVPNAGAPIPTSFLNPAGTALGDALPTGAPTDRVETPIGKVTASIVDVASLNAFVLASDVDLDLVRCDGPSVLNGDENLLSKLESVRIACGDYLRMRRSEFVVSPTSPRLTLVDHATTHDGFVDTSADIRALGFILQKIHHALPMTGALGLAAAASLRETVVNKIASGQAGDMLRVRHPKGVVNVTAHLRDVGSHQEVRSVGVVRTARKLMSGEIYLRAS